MKLGHHDLLLMKPMVWFSGSGFYVLPDAPALKAFVSKVLNPNIIKAC